MVLAKVLRRFWAKVNITEACWEWAAYRNPSGYGNFNCATYPEAPKSVLAHRYAWEITHGPIPRGMLICHRCDNPACVRPDHLFLGTQKDNMHDCVNKQRHAAVTHPDRLPKGAKHHYAMHGKKISREVASDIRQATGRQKDIAAKYNVDPSLVSRIKTGKIWRDFS